MSPYIMHESSTPKERKKEVEIKQQHERHDKSRRIYIYI